jgi:hypothetical protein
VHELTAHATYPLIGLHVDASAIDKQRGTYSAWGVLKVGPQWQRSGGAVAPKIMPQHAQHSAFFWPAAQFQALSIAHGVAQPAAAAGGDLATALLPPAAAPPLLLRVAAPLVGHLPTAPHNNRNLATGAPP